MNIKAECKTIAQLFAEPRVLEVPPFQRNYSWKEEQTNEFWSDIMHCIKNKNKQYFIGQMILVRDQDPDKAILILDGQQRLTTSMLLICAMYDFIIFNLDSNNNQVSRFANSLDRYIRIQMGISVTPKLKLNRYDSPFFESIYKQEEFDTPKQESHKLIKRNYENYYKKIENEYEINGIDNLEIIFKTLVEYFIYAEISFSIIEDAHILFESMNGKGLDLSKADLVKNLLFSKLKNNHSYDKVDQKWGEIIENIADKDLTSFLMYYWSSSYEEIRKNQIFLKFKEKIKNERDAEHEIEKIKNESLQFSFLRKPTNHPKKEVQQLLLELEAINIDISQILILAILNKYSNNTNELKKYLEYVISFLLRCIVCKRQSNILLPIFCSLAQEIRNKNIDFNLFKSKLEVNAPKDLEFENEFMNFKTKNNNLSKYILSKINDSITNKKEYILNIEKLHLEHIIPKAWEKDNHWKTIINKKELENLGFGDDFIDYLGNHTLLFNKSNMAFKNKSFSIKKEGDSENPGYKKSDIPSTKKLKDMKEFYPKCIIDRQRTFLLIAKKIWTS